MQSVHKIFLERSDSVELAVQAILSADATRVVVNIPRGSVFASSVEPFRTLHREAGAVGKELEVESVDDQVLEFASLAGMRASNPIFRVRDRAVSDIIIRDRPPRRAPSVAITAAPESQAPSPEKKTKKRVVRPAPPPPAEATTPPPPPVISDLPPKRSYRWMWWTGGLLLFLVAGWWFSTFVFSGATVVVALEKTTVPFNAAIEVSDDAAAVAATGSSITLPGLLLTDRRNLEMEFPATGREEVSAKAAGTLTVSNRFSSAPQVLVATTRFESPDGKIFRLNQRVTIPGATVTSGNIVPSSIDVAVTADAPGAEYNVGPGASWRIPGFAGTPRYDGFLVEAKKSFSGGLVGERVVASAADRAAAREKLEATLRDALEGQMLVARSESYRLLDGAASFTISKEDITLGGASSGVFQIFIEAEARHLLFDETMLRDALTAQAARTSSLANPVAHDISISYGSARVDLARGDMSFSVTGDIVLKERVTEEQVASTVAGKKQNEVQLSIAGIAGIEQIAVSLRPSWALWLKRIPADPSRIAVEFQ